MAAGSCTISTAIADYLEDALRRPSVAVRRRGRRAALTRFVQNWTETVLQTGLIRLVVLDIHRHLGPEDQAYFRQDRARSGSARRWRRSSRTARRGCRPSAPASTRCAAPSSGRSFVAGKAPAYADYIVFGAFQWARAISDFELLAADDPVRAWRGRMLDLFGGLARRAPAYGG